MYIHRFLCNIKQASAFDIACVGINRENHMYVFNYVTNICLPVKMSYQVFKLYILPSGPRFGLESQRLSVLILKEANVCVMNTSKVVLSHGSYMYLSIYGRSRSKKRSLVHRKNQDVNSLFRGHIYLLLILLCQSIKYPSIHKPFRVNNARCRHLKITTIGF